MPHERLRPLFVFDEEKLKQLQQIVPEAFADDKINWNVLKEVLGEHLEEEGTEAEHFGLFWPGKREARKIASVPSKGTLIPAKGEGVNEETTKNIFIEGENLETLKLLQKSYAGKIKMIYIDPPYNTGNDFVYDDNFTEPLEEYLKYTGQMDEEGRLLTTNKKADGRFHSKWLSMMYPRLRLARNLLREDGAIFISIDDNEAANLKKICDEIFGEENFISVLVWNQRLTGGHDSKDVNIVHEYILVYCKNRQTGVILKNIASDTNYPEQDPNTGVTFKWDSLWTVSHGYTKNCDYPILAPDGTEIWPWMCHSDGIKVKGKARWFWSRETYQEKKDEVLIEKKNENWKVYKKVSGEKGIPIKSLLDKDRVGGTSHGKDELGKLLGKPDIFPNPKPSSLIKELLIRGSDDKDIILDFFAGSASTAQAVFVINSEQKVKRKFICIQLPETCDATSEAYKAGYKTISDIGKERIRRVVGTMSKNQSGLDFKVFHLDRSHFKDWKNYTGGDLEYLEGLFKGQETPLIDGWKPENLLIEVILQEGFPLDSNIVELKDYKKNVVTQVSSEFCQHKLFVSFDEKIAQDTSDNLKMEGEDIFICLDNALTNEQKVTLSDKGFLKTI